MVIAERARLAMLDPDGEHRAVAPVSGVRARWILLTMAEQDAAEAARRRVIASSRPDRHPDGREVLDRLGVDPGRGRGVVRCPAHDDDNASLSWRLAEDGRALLHCFAGCDFREIVGAVA